MAVVRVGASLGCSDRGVVDQHVQRRHVDGERVGEARDLIQAGEVGDDQMQAQRFCAVFDQARHRLVTTVLVRGVQIHGRAVIDKPARRRITDAVGGAGDENCRRGGNRFGHNSFRGIEGTTADIV